MSTVFIGSQAVAAGVVTKYQLSKNYQRLLPDLYAPKGDLSLDDWIYATWKWSKGRGVITGLAAAAWHGAKWVDIGTPIEINVDNTKPPRTVITRNETLLDDEVVTRRGIPVTTVPRTVFDLARRDAEDKAIARLDALAQATRFDHADVLEVARRHPGLRGSARVPKLLNRVDAGAESPQETKLRLVLVAAGFPRPQTQISVPRPNGRRYFLDMGWPELMVAVEYDGQHHRTDRLSFTADVARAEYLASLGWIVIRVLADHRQRDIIERVRRARLSRDGLQSTQLPESVA